MTASALPPAAATERLARLRQQGAQHADPVGFHYLEALARRTQIHQGSTQRQLETMLLQAIAQYQRRCATTATTATTAGDASNSVAGVAMATVTPAAPQDTLADLVRYLAQHDPARATVRADEPTSAHRELRSVRSHRDTWAQLRVTQQVRQALLQVPHNAGPLNSHRVALQSLALMRDLSPDYLHRFMTHIDTLLSLEQGDRAPPPRAKLAAAGDRGKTVKPPRKRAS